MALRPLLAVLFVAGSICASAEERRPYEIMLGPAGYGYSPYFGLIVGLESSIAVRLSDHLQWDFGAGTALITKRLDRYSVHSSLRYNFNADLARSWWLSLGVEYGTAFKCCGENLGWNGLTEVGKRFMLNESGTWTYAPFTRISTNGDRWLLSINLIAFTYSF